MKTICRAFCTLTLSLCLSNSEGQPPAITFQSQALTGITSPVDIINAHDGSDRMFIVQQNGIVRVWNRSMGVAPATFLNIGSSGLNLIANGGEQGLLSMAFHPSFNGTTNRFFFVYFTNTAGNIEIARFQTTVGDANTADGSTFTSLLIIPHPVETNHNGGKLNFGPDGYLYFATGDGGSGNDPNNNAQNGLVLLGKMFRIDINGTSAYGAYSVPPDNPFIGNAAFDERIYAYGLRNPFRWSFDRANGNMWIGDVGQSAREEIDYRPAGSTAGINYGWRCFEGTIQNTNVTLCDPPSDVPPIFDYLNPAQGQAVTGGFVYRGSQFPTFRGYYMAVDYLSMRIFILWPDGVGGWNNNIQMGTQNITGFGEAEDGTLYAVGNNAVFRVIATGGTPLPVTLISFDVRKLAGENELTWVTGQEQNTARFLVQYSLDGRNFDEAGVVEATRIESGSSYAFRHARSGSESIYYRLAIVDDDGAIAYSNLIQVPGDAATGKIYPTIVRDHRLNIVAPAPASALQVINGNGVIVFQKPLGNFTGTLSVQLPFLPKGVYFVNVLMKSKVMRGKILIE